MKPQQTHTKIVKDKGRMQWSSQSPSHYKKYYNGESMTKSLKKIWQLLAQKYFLTLSWKMMHNDVRK